MSRIARIKPNGAIFHIMCRSVSEILLFRDDDDKTYYLNLLKKYCDRFNCTVYAYCLMNNHLHLHFDPKGFDISKFMLCLNTAYVVYYNKKYCRHGHLFQGRFASKLIKSDVYNITLSAYIHNNPKDIEGFKGREHEYPFSSLGIYLGLRKDKFQLVDTKFILGFFGNLSIEKAIRSYAEFLNKLNGELQEKLINECAKRFVVNEYKSERVEIARDIEPKTIIHEIFNRYGILMDANNNMKYNREMVNVRACCAFFLRVLCNCTYKEICRNIGNITISGVARLYTKGHELFKSSEEYRKLFNELAYKAA